VLSSSKFAPYIIDAWSSKKGKEAKSLYSQGVAKNIDIGPNTNTDPVVSGKMQETSNLTSAPGYNIVAFLIYIHLHNFWLFLVQSTKFYHISTNQICSWTISLLSSIVDRTYMYALRLSSPDNATYEYPSTFISYRIYVCHKLDTYTYLY